MTGIPQQNIPQITAEAGFVPDTRQRILGHTEIPNLSDHFDRNDFIFVSENPFFFFFFHQIIGACM